MKYYESQISMKFDNPIWDHDPELLVMDQILDHNIEIIMLVSSCFPNAHSDDKRTVGCNGMTLEQIVRSALYKQHKRLTYRDLSDHTVDSYKGRLFMKMKPGQYISHQTLHDNISKLSSEVLEKIHKAIVQYSINLGVDDGQKIRTDSTVVKTNIHYPNNASLSWDCIHVSSRLLRRVGSLLTDISFRSYAKSGKKLFFKIVNTKGKQKRLPLFTKLIKRTKACQRQVAQAIEALSYQNFQDEKSEKKRQKLLKELETLQPNIEIVIDVTYRREILDEQVPVSEKIFSIFEPHTDCIVKGSRDILFGHKINLTGGKSNLIFDCILRQGNPADSSYYSETLDNLSINFEVIPRDVATDGGYASTANLLDAKKRGIINIVFNKVRGVLQNSTTSKNMETILKKWRSGMEAIISNFKRGLNSSVCTWTGWEGFKRFVLLNLITFNMRVIANWIIAKMN